MRVADEGPTGARGRALIVILWRAGLRISEALGLAETDLDRLRGAILVRQVGNHVLEGLARIAERGPLVVVGRRAPARTALSRRCRPGACPSSDPPRPRVHPPQP